MFAVARGAQAVIDFIIILILHFLNLTQEKQWVFFLTNAGQPEHLFFFYAGIQ